MVTADEETWVEETVWVRLGSEALSAAGRQVGEVDGIPIAPHVGLHRVGTFSVKEDLESSHCRLASEAGVPCKCLLTVTESSDRKRRIEIMSSCTNAPTLSPDAFDDYDAARAWAHP